MLTKTNQSQVGFKLPCCILSIGTSICIPFSITIIWTQLVLKSELSISFEIKTRLQISTNTKTFQESAYDVTIEDLFNATVKLEEKEKVYSNAEGEVTHISKLPWYVLLMPIWNLCSVLCVGMLSYHFLGGFGHQAHLSPWERGRHEREQACNWGHHEWTNLLSDLCFTITRNSTEICICFYRIYFVSR